MTTIFQIILSAAQTFLLFAILKQLRYIAADSQRREDLKVGLDSLRKMLKDG